MLTRSRALLRLLLGVAVVAASLLVTVSPASADCTLVWGQKPNGSMGWVEDCSDSGGDEGGEDTGGDNGGGDDTGGEPACNLDWGPEGTTTWCEGSMACWANVPSTFPEEEWEEVAAEQGAGPRPSPDHQLVFVMCELGAPYWDWVTAEDTGPSLWDLAWQAFGNIATPEFTLAFSPPTQSYVNLDTWYWAEGPSDGEIVGDSTGAVNAIATPDRIEVDPGDGSGVMECPFAVDEGDECLHTYVRASVDHPDGYPARMRLVYDIAFTNNGDPLELDGLPTTLESPWVDGPLPVAEVAAIVIE
jgi:hypothetical protein